MADAAPRVLVHLLHQLARSCAAVAHHGAGTRWAAQMNLPFTTSEAEVVAFQERLDDDLVAVAWRVACRRGAAPLGADVGEHAAPVGGVQRLHHHRPAELLRDVEGLVFVLGHVALGHGHAVVAEEALGLSLSPAISTPRWAVVEAIVAWMRFWWTPVPEHDERALVEAQVGDAAGAAAPRWTRWRARAPTSRAGASGRRALLEVEVTSRPAHCSTTSRASLPARTPTRSSSIS